MKRTTVRLVMLLSLIAVLSIAFPAFGQGTIANPPNPNANISWPPPVYIIRGETEIRGSANLPNMTNYFISFRPLNDDLTPMTSEFLPAVLPSTAAVQDDVLGVWDTSIVDDGIYTLRLTVNVRGGQPVTQEVGPIRVENNPSPFAQQSIQPPQNNTGGGIVIQPTTIFVQPTLELPTPTPTFDPTPRVTVRGASANVRTGDSTDFGVITTLPQGTSLVIVGISNRGTGWYQVRLNDGRLGWMAPSVVDVSGNLNTVPAVVPPPPPATPIPTAIPATPVPATSTNLVAGIVVLDPASPNCGQTFTVGFDVANLGTQQSLASGTVTLTDVRVADGSTQGSTVGGFPVLIPGQTFRVNMPLTVSTWYNEQHRITLVIDQGNTIPETNKGDNTQTITYTLNKGGCP
ncbi:MAG: SH3 domain-containing protein [Anaerolineae bacterium]